MSGRVQALFTYLCVSQQPQDRDRLAELLWNSQSEQEAKRNLRYVLRDLRKVVGDYLLVDGQIVSFNFDLPHWFDITSFTTYLAPTMQAAASSIDIRILQELLNLYTGDFLAGFHVQDAPSFERWMLAQRRYFHDAMIYGLQLATQQHLELGDYEAGLALNQYLLTMEPWREEAHRQRMLLLASSGQRSAALMQYELCCQILEEELDAPPMNETTSLYTRIKSGLWFVDQESVESFRSQRVVVPAYPVGSNYSQHDPSGQNGHLLESLSPNFHVDLGTMPTPNYLIGRQKELWVLNRWLENADSRLAVLVGLGGQGKSALAAWFVHEQQTKITLASTEQPSATRPKDSQYVKNWPIDPAENKGESTVFSTAVTKIIWRSLTQRPTCVELLQDLVQQLTDISYSEMPDNFDKLVTLFFAALNRDRCLIVFDGIETVIASETEAGEAEAKVYEGLFRLLLERKHHSYILLTSRMHPTALAYGRQQQKSMSYLTLGGLTAEDSQELLTARGLDTTTENYHLLHQWYMGNPQMLTWASDVVYELFDNDVDAFIEEDIHFLGNIGKTVAQQIERHTLLEQEILQILTEAKRPLARHELWAKLTLESTKESFYEALRKLQRACMIEQESGQFGVAVLPAAVLTEQIYHT